MQDLSEDVIADKVRAEFEGADVSVSLQGNKALISVVSEKFQNMSRVQKQQAVYACIQAEIADGSLHAVTIKADVPDQSS